ncbi:MAG: metallophosphoesterase, partial [Prevotella sp.]|nr:metallophosphoesterase [Prevotella sp.]
MKRYIYIIAIALATSLSAAAQKTIEILHTNDTHSCIMPLNPNLADTLVAGRGGFIRRMEMIRQERQANPDVLVFDSGDFSQGSPYYTLFKGEVETELMSAMKYDAVT